MYHGKSTFGIGNEPLCPAHLSGLNLRGSSQYNGLLPKSFDKIKKYEKNAQVGYFNINTDPRRPYDECTSCRKDCYQLTEVFKSVKVEALHTSHMQTTWKDIVMLCFLSVNWNSRKKAECFIDNGFQVRSIHGADIIVHMELLLLKFLNENFLYVRVFQQAVEHPR